MSVYSIPIAPLLTSASFVSIQRASQIVPKNRTTRSVATTYFYIPVAKVHPIARTASVIRFSTFEGIDDGAPSEELEEVNTFFRYHPRQKRKQTKKESIPSSRRKHSNSLCLDLFYGAHVAVFLQRRTTVFIDPACFETDALPLAQRDPRSLSFLLSFFLFPFLKERFLDSLRRRTRGPNNKTQPEQARATVFVHVYALRETTFRTADCKKHYDENSAQPSNGTISKYWLVCAAKTTYFGQRSAIRWRRLMLVSSRCGRALNRFLTSLFINMRG